MSALNALSRCPVCRTNRSTSAGCCKVCQKDLFAPQQSGETVTLGVYSGRLERAVRAYKFHGATRLGHLFAGELAEQIRHHGWEVDALCAVPLHLLRVLGRGYNQAAVLAKQLAAELDAPYLSALTRVRPTRQQARLTRAERFDNVRAAFRVRVAPERLHGKHILLVDDVITSGATTAACKEILLSAGVRSVKLAAVARAKLS